MERELRPFLPMTSPRLRVRALSSALFALGAVILAGGTGTACSTRNAEPPYLQISRQALSDLPCEGDVQVNEIVDLFVGDDPEFCAYGCGQSQRYLCSDVTGDCRETWPSFCP